MMLTVTWDSREYKGNLDELDGKTQRALKTIFAFQAVRSTAWMKTNAPWTDRTGAARGGIHAEYQGDLNILLTHAVSYGIWLEIANSGKYQIILPAMRQAIRELQQLIDGLWGRI